MNHNALDTISDTDLLTRMIAGEERAWREFHRRFDCLVRAVRDPSAVPALDTLAAYLTATGWVEGPSPFWHNPARPYRTVVIECESDIRRALRDLADAERRPLALLLAELFEREAP